MVVPNLHAGAERVFERRPGCFCLRGSRRIRGGAARTPLCPGVEVSDWMGVWRSIDDRRDCAFGSAPPVHRADGVLVDLHARAGGIHPAQAADLEAAVLTKG